MPYSISRVLEMEPVTLVVDKLKSFAKSSHDFVDKLVQRRNPIEILKRLQRESFSDLMKLRERQDKIERMFTLFRSSKGNPFQEASTNVRGVVDVLGGILMMDNFDLQNPDALSRAGIRTGIDSRFTFETIIRQRDTFIAEFVASQKGSTNLNDDFGSSLSLSKVCYMANVTDWLSLTAIPVGAQCRDVGITTSSSPPVKGLSDFTSFGPPIMSQYNGSAISATVRKSNVIVSLAQFVSGLEMHPSLVRVENCFSTFGKVVCRLSTGTKLSLLGLHQVPRSSSQHFNLGALAIPIRISKHREDPDTSLEVVSSEEALEPNPAEKVSASSIALMLESELDESIRIEGWVEMKQSNPRYLQWAVTVSDTPDNELGWGLSVGGITQGPSSWERLQVEGFLKFNLGERFSLQPGLVYVNEGTSQLPAIMFRSSWEL